MLCLTAVAAALQIQGPLAVSPTVTTTVPTAPPTSALPTTAPPIVPPSMFPTLTPAAHPTMPPNMLPIISPGAFRFGGVTPPIAPPIAPPTALPNAPLTALPIVLPAAWTSGKGMDWQVVTPRHHWCARMSLPECHCRAHRVRGLESRLVRGAKCNAGKWHAPCNR